LAADSAFLVNVVRHSRSARMLCGAQSYAAQAYRFAPQQWGPKEMRIEMLRAMQHRAFRAMRAVK
jgi:hypothetical protein